MNNGGIFSELVHIPSALMIIFCNFVFKILQCFIIKYLLLVLVLEHTVQYLYLYLYCIYLT